MHASKEVEHFATQTNTIHNVTSYAVQSLVDIQGKLPIR